jgi:hypothetical protein
MDAVVTDDELPEFEEADVESLVRVGGVFDRVILHSSLNHNPDERIDLANRETLQGRLSPLDLHHLGNVYLLMERLVFHDTCRPPQVAPLFFPPGGLAREQKRVSRILESALKRSLQTSEDEKNSPRGRLITFFLSGPDADQAEPPVNLDPDEYALMIRRILHPISLRDLAPEEAVCNICYNTFGTPTDRGDGKQHRYEQVELPVHLPCRHMFGRGCLEMNLTMGRYACPYCKRDYKEEIGERAWDAFVEAELPTPWWMRLITGE